MIFVKGLSGPETPRLSTNKEWYAVEMNGNPGSVVKISDDGTKFSQIIRHGRPNGLALDYMDRIWIADTYPEPALLLLDKKNELTIFSRGPAEEEFLFPNDLCFGPDGYLYMTDSGILLDDWAPGGKLREDWEKAEFDGRVYRIDIESGEILKIDSGIKFTNGIAIGPDGNLYANEMVTGDIFRYELGVDGKVGPRCKYANCLAPEWTNEGFRGPDGMAFGEDGRLYVAMFGQADITVIDVDGQIQERIDIKGSFPTNVAFGPDHEHEIYISEAELGQIERYPVEQGGAVVYYGKK